jgi:hypothetical protein
MPAVSGSTTQVKTSSTTAADLAGTPDDAFLDGDLASVTALWPNSTFRLKRTALGTAPDNVTSIATFSGNGYWEVFPAGGNTLVFADIAALAAFNDVGLGDGAEVYVQSVRSYFVKRIETPPAGNAITIVPTLSGDGGFYRVAMPQFWVNESAIFIDTASGDDENDGLTALTPIATLDELSRRWPVFEQTTVVTFLSVVPVVLSVLIGSRPTTAGVTSSIGELFGVVKDWYVDPVNGLNSNDGMTELTPIRTPQELSRRLAMAPREKPLGRPWGAAYGDDVWVNVWQMSDLAALGNWPDLATERFIFQDLPTASQVNVRAHEQGITRLGTGTITAVQAGDPSLGRAVEIEASGLAASWTNSGYLYKVLRILTSATADHVGAVGCIGVDLGTANKRARCAQFFSYPGSVDSDFITPSAGDTFEIIDLPSGPTVAHNPSGPLSAEVKCTLLEQLVDYNYETGTFISGPVYCVACIFPPSSPGSGYLSVQSGGLLLMYGCLVYGDPTGFRLVEIDVYQGGRVVTSGSMFVSTYAAIYLNGDDSVAAFYRGTIFQTGANCYMYGSGGCGTVYLSDVGIFNSVATFPTFKLGPASNLFITASNAYYQGYVFGSDNDVVAFQLGVDARASYADRNKLTVTFTGAVKFANFGVTGKTILELPFRDIVASADSQATFVATA